MTASTVSAKRKGDPQHYVEGKIGAPNRDTAECNPKLAQRYRSISVEHLFSGKCEKIRKSRLGIAKVVFGVSRSGTVS